MPTLDEIANQETVQTNEIPMGEPAEFQEAPQQPNRINEILNKILTAETGAGSVEDYLDHPMNFLKSRGLAKILRGFTGIFGSLSLAVIDIALGTLEFSKERKQGAVVNDVSSGGGIPS